MIEMLLLSAPERHVQAEIGDVGSLALHSTAHLTFTMGKVHDSQRQVAKGQPMGILQLRNVTQLLLHRKNPSIGQSITSKIEIEGGAYRTAS